MNRILVWLLAFCALSAPGLKAREIAGQWQGTLHVEGGLRSILRITKAENGDLSATLSSIDQSPREVPVTSISLDGSALRFASDVFRARYEGTLSEDGTFISGQWFGPRTPGSSLPLDFHLAIGEARWPQDASPHTVRFVIVDHGVRLEVLDWGGTGRPLVFLAGLGNDAHVFDKFAPKLTSVCHVYALSRRGFGASSAPEPANDNYSADRLGDDVLEAIDALKLDRPVLAGHSIAGEELSSIGSRHPEKVAGLIYLDAGYPYAFYDPAVGDLGVESNQVRTALLQLTSSQSPQASKRLIQELLKTDLPRLEKSLGQEQKQLDAMSDAEIAARAPTELPWQKFAYAIIAGEQKYTTIKCPVLAIFAVAPLPDPAKADPLAPSAEARAWYAAQANAFEAGVPSARVVRLQNADHYVFMSNEAEVRQEMNDFLKKLPPESR